MALLDLGRAGVRRWPLAFEELERATAGALAAPDRPLGALGHLALWANLESGLYLVVVGAWLVPALSIPQAVVATLIGAALGAALVAIAVRLGAIENRPAVVLHRAALGETGANLYGALAVFRHVAFGVVQLAIAAELAAAVMERQGLAGARPLWAAALGTLVLLMALAGPVTVVRRWLVPSTLLTLLIAVVFTYSAWADFGVPTMLKRAPSGGWPSMTAAVDLVAALALVWLPVATDLGRLGAPRRSGAAAFLGLAGMTAWFALLGVLFVPAVDGRDLAGFLLATPTGALALILVVVLELDGAFVSLYALASTVRAWAPNSDTALPAVVGGAGVFALGAALLDPFDYGDALMLLGAAFAPALGVLLAARLGRRWTQGAASGLAGALSWTVGFLAYNWTAPLDLPAWTGAMSALFHDALRLPFPADVPGLSATALGFVASFAVTAAVGLPAGARRAGGTR